jgi:hypothetical protein
MAGYADWHQCNTLLNAPLHGAVEMMVSLRLKDELIAEMIGWRWRMGRRGAPDRQHAGAVRVGACE